MFSGAVDFVKAYTQSSSSAVKPEISEQDFEEFGSLFQLNDRVAFELQDEFTQADVKKYELNAPRVVVVGLTSAGKSSLLERIIGYRIFPIKDTVCTRRPFAVQLRNDNSINASSNGSSSADSATLRLRTAATPGTSTFTLPQQLEEVRLAIDREQCSNVEEVRFSEEEIHAEVLSKANETFTFTDLPGIFLVSEKKIGQDYAKSRAENEKLKEITMEMTKKYISMPNTIVLVVISASDWSYGMNNDSLISHLAEWLEEARKLGHEVPVYGVITKLDTQDSLSVNSPIKKILMNQLGKDHILNGLRVRKWIPVVSSPAILNEPDKTKAQQLETEAIVRCLKACIPAPQLAKLPLGRAALLRQLKQALLIEIASTHNGLRQRLIECGTDLEARLTRLPVPLSVTEKRRLFDAKLKLLETKLDSLIGARGIGLNKCDEARSLRLQLMVDAPLEYERALLVTSLRGDMIEEVKQILNQAALEQGGNFDSDLTFTNLSMKIIERFTYPTMLLVDKCATIVKNAILEATRHAFGDYKDLANLILQHQCGYTFASCLSTPSLTTLPAPTTTTITTIKKPAVVSSGDGKQERKGIDSGAAKDKAETAAAAAAAIPYNTNTNVYVAPRLRMTPAEMENLSFFELLQASTSGKVINLLDAFKTMACFHPMWRNFDSLYSQILLQDNVNTGTTTSTNNGKSDTFSWNNAACAVVGNKGKEHTLQNILELPQLAAIAKSEGELAIRMYEKESGTAIAPAHVQKISKHFARVEVMGYILRMTLLSTVYPLVLRDLRDGLFKGVTFGCTHMEHSVSTLLRMKLLFDQQMEKRVLECMEPSAEDTAERVRLTRKKDIINSLQTDFIACQKKVTKLQELLFNPV